MEEGGLCDTGTCHRSVIVQRSQECHPQAESSVFSRCDKGYTLSGDEESACLASGSWSHSSPVCELVKCSQPEDINNGKYILSGLTYLSIASYSCENGYR